MTRKELWTYGGIAALAVVAYLLLRNSGASASAVAPPDYLNYNVPSGYSGQTTFGPLASVPGLTINNGAPSCGCSAGGGLSSTFYAAQQQLLDAYNASIGTVVSSAIQRLGAAATGIYGS